MFHVHIKSSQALCCSVTIGERFGISFDAISHELSPGLLPSRAKREAISGQAHPGAIHTSALLVVSPASLSVAPKAVALSHRFPHGHCHLRSVIYKVLPPMEPAISLF